jgi:hypothetical protein
MARPGEHLVDRASTAVAWRRPADADPASRRRENALRVMARM